MVGPVIYAVLYERRSFLWLVHGQVTIIFVVSVCLSNALDRPSNQFFPFCVFVNRSVVERLRQQFFTDFHEILHAAQKCGRFVAYCLW